VPGVNDRTHGLPDGDMPARAARDHARELLEGRLLEEAREQLAKQVEKIDLDDGSEAAKAMLAEDRERAWGDALLLFLEGRLRL
jgi:hypothetical protein